MHINLAVMYIGIYFTLCLYYLFVYLGRKKEKINFYFSILNLAAVLTIYLQMIYPATTFYSSFWAPVWNILVYMLLVWSYSFFFVHFVSIEKFYQLIIKGSMLWFPVCGIIFIAYFFIRQEAWLSVPIHGVTTLSGITAYVYSLYFLLRRHRQLSYTQKRGLIAFLTILIPVLATGLLISFNRQPPGWLFPGITIVYNLFIAFILSGNFNKEHMSLVALKNRLEQKVLERTRELEREKEHKLKFFIDFAARIKAPVIHIGDELNCYLEKTNYDHYLDVVKSNVDKLLRDVMNFLDVDMMERGVFRYHHEKTLFLSVYLDKKIPLFSEWGARKNIAINRQLTEDIFIRADPAALDRIINNLLDNAIKYTPPGGRIDVSLQKENSRAVLKVSDTGIGIPASQLESVFSPFVQLSHEKRANQGIGMGLYIVNRIVRDLGAVLAVESEQGAGTTFTITFPLSAGDCAPAANYISEQPVEHMHSGSLPVDSVYDPAKRTLLFVEDNRDLLILMKSAVAAEFNFYYALNGKQAIQKLHAISLPDIIISDIMMDEMDGFLFYEEISKQEELAALPFLFLTAKSRIEEKIRSYASGAMDFIPKPFSIDELLSKIKTILLNLDEQKHKQLSLLQDQLGGLLKQHGPGDGNMQKTNNAVTAKCLFYRLSARETEVALLLIQGLTNKQIAGRLFVSPKTIAAHIQRIFEKTNTNNRAEAMRLLSDTI